MAGWGIIDDILGALNIIDWGEGFIRGILRGDISGHRIALPHPDADYWKTRNAQGQTIWTLNEVIALLRGYHVTTYNRGFNSEQIWVHVAKRQARFAEYLLRSAGAPVIMDTVDPRNVAYAARRTTMPPRWDDAPKPVRRRRRRTPHPDQRRDRQGRYR